jgi:putative YphP/YqiW family bacilliredoxin
MVAAALSWPDFRAGRFPRKLPWRVRHSSDGAAPPAVPVVDNWRPADPGCLLFFDHPDDSIMPYPPQLVQPMREELTRLGVEELQTAADVDAALSESVDGSVLVVVNSVCGCAAANARPAVAMARQHGTQPDRYVTVFAGQDLEATARMREHLQGIPPSSPFMALLRDGDPVFVLERRHIEGRSASAIASDLVQAFDRHCGDGASSENGPERPDLADAPDARRELPDTFRSIL